MVPPETYESLIACAEEDLWTAEMIRKMDDEKTRIICYHLEQYVEKSIKAKLLQLGISYPKKHNITSLLELLPDKQIATKYIREASILSDYATTFRYTSAVPTVEEMESSFRLAEKIASDVKSIGL